MKTIISLKPWQIVLICALTALSLGLFVSKTLCAVYIGILIFSCISWRKKYVDSINAYNASKHLEMHDMSANMED